MIVAFKPLPQPFTKLNDGGVLEEIDLLVFHTSPKPLNEHVVHPATLAIHADLNIEFLQTPRPLCRGKLASLVGVKDLGNDSSIGECLLQCFQTQSGFYGV